MEFISLFDVIGPNMIGPSSSHTAGAVAMARMARHMFGEKVEKVGFVLYGSFAKTYKGHGTDRALLGGILGFHPDDVRIRDAYKIADELGLEYAFIEDHETEVGHPNTVDIRMESFGDRTMTVRAESIGGGKIRIVRIDNIDVDFTGEYNTLVISHQDRPGLLVHITQCLTNHRVNIAYMRMFREERGGNAFAVVESDERIPEEIITEMAKNPYIGDIMLLEV